MAGEIRRSEESEEIVLGWLLDKESQQKGCIERLTSQDFYTQAHRVIFGAMRELYEENKPVELITVSKYLTEKKKIKKIGGSDYLTELYERGEGYPLTSINYHIGQIKESADRRRLVRRLEEAKKKVEKADSTLEILEIIDRLQQEIRVMQVERGKEIIPQLNLEGYKAWLKSLGTGELTGFDTGFPLLNQITGGLSGLWIIGAGPKMHKSTFALQIASRIARNSGTVIFYDLENGENRILARLHSQYTKLGLEGLRKVAGGMGDEEEVKKYEQGIEEIRELKENFILITDRNEINLVNIEAQIRAVAESRKIEGRKILLIFDPLQKLPSAQKERRLQIDEWLRNFERLKNEFGCSILAISELRRDQNDYSTVTMQDFKESGDIEYTAETLIGINRADKGEDKYKLDILATRDGEKGLVEAIYKPSKPFWYMEEIGYSL